jgi:phage tail-like protein
VSGNGHGNGTGTGDMRTFSGAGFGTLLVQLSGGQRETPPVASNRAYLRAGLPAVYQDGDFGMRFIGALETLLDPIVAILDGLPAHFSPDHAPRDILALLSAWLGVELVESQTVEQRRDALRHAAELSRRRGTRAGLELALRLAFPKLSMRVEDSGGVLVAPPSGGTEPPRASFVVYCNQAIPESTQAAVARCIEQNKPAHATYRLRVKAERKAEG